MDRLGNIGSVCSGGTPSRSNARYWNGGVPWVTTAEVDFCHIRETRQTISAAGLKASAAKVLPPHTVLMAMYGQGKTRGKVCILDIPAATNQACAAIIPGERVSAEYVFYYLQHHYEAIRGLSNAGSQDNLSGLIVKSIEIRYPDSPEQRSIVGVLSDVDEEITALERLAAKKRALNQGMRQELLSGRTRLAGFSQPWSKVRLGDHVTYVKTVALSRAQLDAHSPLKYLHYGDIHTRDSVTLDAANADMPRASSTLAAPAGRLRVGDLVFADASEDLAGVGKSVEITSVPEGGLVPGLHTIAARFDPAALANGFKAYLQFHPQFRSSLVRVAAGTKVLATTRSYISSVELLLPTIPEQRAIARVLREA